MTPNQTTNDEPTDGGEMIEDYEDLLRRDPLIRVLGDSPRVRFFGVFLDADRPLNPTDIIDRADVGSKTWYNHVDALVDSGLVEQVGTAGNSPLYALVDADDDRRAEWLAKFSDWSAAFYRDGSRPTRDA